MSKHSFTREMGFSCSEFVRILPSALDGRAYSIDRNLITCDVDGGTLQLAMGEQKYRKIASISLPYLKIEFTFEGLTELQIEQFLKYFDLRYQRGGG